MVGDEDHEANRYYSDPADVANWAWILGAGMEYGFDNWSLGIEYLYVNLRSADWSTDLGDTMNDNEE